MITKFTDGKWYDGIWGSEDYSETVKLFYMGNLVFVLNTASKMAIVTLPFPVYGASTITVGGGDVVTKIRKEK